ncbi:hypothetical protein BH23BAC1_BH23BAC1_34080 [soil metagenome]
MGTMNNAATLNNLHNKEISKHTFDDDKYGYEIEDEADDIFFIDNDEEGDCNESDFYY